jgi:ribosomal protein L32
MSANTTEELRSDLSTLQKEAETADQKQREKEREYQRKRTKLIKQKMEDEGLTWCTKCGDFTPKSDAALILTKGTEKYSHGYQGSMYGFRSFSRLHRICTDCSQEAFKKHGRKGEYDSMADDQACFYMESIDDMDRRDDGLYIKKFGEWKRFTGEKKLRNCEMWEYVVMRATQKWDIPASIS